MQTGEQQAEEDAAGVAEFVKFIRYFLLAFGGIALFVGAFVIFNTLSITIAQRTRELATLRTLGASRRQVLRSVVLEGLVIGFVASAVGVALGILLAKGLSALFAALNLDLPQSGTIVQPRTVIVSLLVGTLVTLFASVWPAIRATRIPPISAVREGGAVVKQLSRRTFVAALVVSGLSAAALVYGLLGEGVSGGMRALGIGLGALGLFVGIALLAPRLVRPLAAFVGAPSERFGGAAGRLARENAVRNPSRTAATAAALMIGLTLVTFVATFGRGLLASDEKAIRDQLTTSHVITSQNGWTNMPVAAGEALGESNDVSLVSAVRYDRAKLQAGREVDVNGVDPATIADGYRFEWKQGSDAVLAGLGAKGAVIRDDLAKDEGLGIGSTVRYLTPSGKQVEVVVRGVYEPSEFDPLLGHVVVSQEAFDATFPRPGDILAFVNASSSEGVTESLAAFPDAKVQTQDEFVEARSAWLSDVMNLFYVLLALSVIVSLFGMVNTLVLAVFERTREVGMLRAVGMTRRQTRRMIRAESVITALIGAALGIPLGIGLAALVTQSLAQFGVDVLAPGGDDRDLRDRGGARGDRGGDHAGAACVAAERPERAAVRVARWLGDLGSGQRGPPAPQRSRGRILCLSSAAAGVRLSRFDPCCCSRSTRERPARRVSWSTSNYGPWAADTASCGSTSPRRASSSTTPRRSGRPCSPPRGGGGRRGRLAERAPRDRDHQPARDDAPVGPARRPPVERAIVWQDRRTAARCAELPVDLDPRADRARPRPVLLGDEARVAAPRGRQPPASSRSGRSTPGSSGG